MRIFKNKTFKRIYAFASLVLIYVLVYTFITEQLSDITYGDYLEKDIDSIVENQEDVGLIFIGASRLYHGMIPSVFEEKLGYDNVLIAATAIQPMCGTYYYMKELVETVKPEIKQWNRRFNFNNRNCW